MLESFFTRSASHLLLAGITAVFTGLITIVWPGITLVVLAILWGSFALAEGIVQIYAGCTLKNGPKGTLLASGVAGVIFGLIVLINPDIGITLIAWILGFWMLIRAIEEIGTSFDGSHDKNSRLLYRIVGVFYIIAGFIFFTAPDLSAAMLALWLGVLALCGGITLIILSLRIRSQARDLRDFPEDPHVV